MYFFFILFFISLTAIIFMIGRKILFVNNAEIISNHHFIAENFLTEILDFKKIKYSIIKNVGKIIHTIVWLTLKIYIISLNFINKKRKEIVIKIKDRLNKNRKENIIEEKKEVSKYIKMIAEYRHKIRKIKHKIKEEEGIE